MIIPDKEPVISVGLLTDKKISFELHGDFYSFGFSQTFSGIYTAEISGNSIICKSEKNKIEISDEIIFEPNNFKLESFIVRDVVIGKDFHWQRKEKQRFKGSLKIKRINGQISAINLLPLEDYLVSVISSEMSARSSLQLLKAHAVVSRSWLLAQILSPSDKNNSSSQFIDTDHEIIKWYDREEHEFFDICADDHCQRYQGITKIITQFAQKAIDQTKGLVLMQNNEICDARYSKACGGITELFENVWDSNQHKFKSIVDYKFEPDNFNLNLTKEANARKWILSDPPAFCNVKDKKVLSQVLIDFDQETEDFYRWKTEYTQQQLKALLKEKLGKDLGDILDLIPIQRGVSGRLIKLKIRGSKNSLIIGKELEIRKALSKSHLYSSAIVIDKEEIVNDIPQKFIIHGAGWGHGVGFCQIGAAVMASSGYMFDEILLHYFKDLKLKKIY